VETQPANDVLLPDGETGSAFFHRILSHAVGHFPGALRPAGLTNDPRVFKDSYGEATVRFEAARIAAPQRVDIARHLMHATLDSLRLRSGGETLPLSAALSRPAAAPDLVTHKLNGKPGLRAEIPLEGRTYSGKDALALVERMHAEHHMTDAARAALRWVILHIEAAGGALDLSAHRFALLGAGAELSPLPLLLNGGATVLCIDVKPPDPRVLSNGNLAGTIVHTRRGNDLLAAPGDVVAAVRQFAEAGPVHLGLLAYAPGKGRELRIASVMNAIARALGPSVVQSLAMLISPTAPAETQAEDLQRAQHRAGHAPRWQRALAAGRLLPAPGHRGSGVAQVPRAIIPLQGSGYLAAQYLAKIVVAEALGAEGLDGNAAPLTLSANVAGITNTRSLSHPLFQVAFLGAPTFEVRIFEPDTTRALNGLLMLHDLLNPEAPGAAARKFASPVEKARAQRTQQIHGGVYNLPWQFDAVVRTAALVGAQKRPGLLLRAFG